MTVTLLACDEKHITSRNYVTSERKVLVCSYGLQTPEGPNISLESMCDQASFLSSIDLSALQQAKQSACESTPLPLHSCLQLVLPRLLCFSGAMNELRYMPDRAA
jgi:hypothetical protein